MQTQRTKHSTRQFTQPPHPSFPRTFKPDDVEARRAERERMTGECRGYSTAVRGVLAWVVAATEPSARASRLYLWADHQLWQAARAALAKNPKALEGMPDTILLRITHGEAVAIYNGLTSPRCDHLPTGDDPYEIMDAASPGLGTAVKGLVYDVALPPLSELRWKLTSTPEDPYRPTWTNWFCLPWRL